MYPGWRFERPVHLHSVDEKEAPMKDKYFPVISRLRRLGHRFKVIRSEDVDALQARLGKLISADHPWFDFLRFVGILCTDGPYGMLSPDAVVEAHRAQEAFYEHAVIGDQAGHTPTRPLKKRRFHYEGADSEPASCSWTELD